MKTTAILLSLWLSVVIGKRAKKHSHGPGLCPVESANFPSVATLGEKLLAEGNADAARDCFEYALEFRTHERVLVNLGSIYYSKGEFKKAVTSYRRAVELDKNAGVFNNLGITLQRMGKHKAAVKALEAGVRTDPSLGALHYNLGVSLEVLGRFDEARRCLEKAVSIESSPTFVRQLALFSFNRGELREALDLWSDVASDSGTLYNMGIAHLKLQNPEEAASMFERASELEESAYTYNNWGLALQDLGDLTGAGDKYKRATELDPTLGDAFTNWGTVHKARGDRAAAVAAYRRALEADGASPNPNTYNNLGVVLGDGNQFNEAIDAYTHALALKPDLVEADCGRVNARTRVCHWPGLEGEWRRMRALVEAHLDAGQDSPVMPLHALSYSFPPSLLKRMAEAKARSAAERARYLQDRARPFPQPHKREGPLKLAYLSGDFGNHPVTYLLADLLGRHSPDKFEVFCFATNPSDGSSWRERVEAAASFHDLSGMSLEQQLGAIRKEGIDVLIELGGLTQTSQLELLSLRPAPMQASFLGYAGTTGAHYVDYYICDFVACPVEEESSFTESILRLPEPFSYLANSHSELHKDVLEASGEFSRSDYGLPDGVLFCSFNQLYKVSSSTFQSWSRILKRVPSAVLWLLELPPQAVENIKLAAEREGLDEGRIVFTPLLPKDVHLRVKTLCDVFLDTHDYNAHSTGVDALWSGVPVVTFPGRTMASRVGASLLTAHGMPELIASSLRTYEDIAVHTAGDAVLPSTRETTESRRLQGALFDPQQWMHAFELSLLKGWHDT